MEIFINHIGYFAKEVLDRTDHALVSGIASRGIYLQPKDDWTLYLSHEKYCGPLTLNLAEGSVSLDNIKAGSPVLINPGEIYFPDENITLSLEDVDIWHPIPIDPGIKFNPINLDSVLSFARSVSPDNPYLPILTEDPEKIPGVAAIGERIRKFQNSLETRNPDNIMQDAIKLLGLGPGLTPLGDDFLLGVLLALNRWGHAFSFQSTDDLKGSSRESSTILVNNLNQTILENTQVKTTRISASLLTCAADGAADERLLVILDGLFSGSAINQANMRNMLRWGNSSGITVLAGMISVLKAKDTTS